MGGSIILAAIILKIRIYGFYRVIPVLNKIFKNKIVFLINILLIGAVMRSVVAVRQTDIKSLVAYSSVRHMGIMLGGFITIINMSLKGSVIIVLAHGFCSSCLFFFVNCHYEITSTRQMLILSGYGFLSSVFSI